jgi:hypothetical protein
MLVGALPLAIKISGESLVTAVAIKQLCAAAHNRL